MVIDANEMRVAEVLLEKLQAEEAKLPGQISDAILSGLPQEVRRLKQRLAEVGGELFDARVRLTRMRLDELDGRMARQDEAIKEADVEVRRAHSAMQAELEECRQKERQARQRFVTAQAHHQAAVNERQQLKERREAVGKELGKLIAENGGAA
jgi:DNA repair ATPase RecN